MAMIKGTSVLLYERHPSGEDPFGHTTYTETVETIDNVLIAPVSGNEVIQELSLDGKKAIYQLAIPKGDTHTWEGNKVEFFGEVFKVIGKPTQGMEDNIPLAWNKKVMVERYE